MNSLSFWEEPLPPGMPLVHPYREGIALHSALQGADDLAKAFDNQDGGLESALHMALIEALEETAKAQNHHPNVGKAGYDFATCESEPHDGFYTYHGSIDTPYVAEYLSIVVKRWLAYQAEKSAHSS